MDTHKPLRNDQVLLRKLEDECLLYDQETCRIHVLNGAAGFVWEMCDGTHSMHDMEDTIQRAYDSVGDANVAEDLRRIVAEFAELDLLDPQQPGSS